METAGDIRRKRRALTADELRRLLAAVPEDRRLAYLFAATTASRRSEIADLRWDDLHLTATKPYVQLRAEATKARRADAVEGLPDITRPATTPQCDTQAEKEIATGTNGPEGGTGRLTHPRTHGTDFSRPVASRGGNGDEGDTVPAPIEPPCRSDIGFARQNKGVGRILSRRVACRRKTKARRLWNGGRGQKPWGTRI